MTTNNVMLKARSPRKPVRTSRTRQETVRTAPQLRDSDYSVATITRGMHWVILTKNPTKKGARWLHRATFRSWVDAMMTYHNAVEDGLIIAMLLTVETADVWMDRLNSQIAH